jgi:hypothetical protein
MAGRRTFDWEKSRAEFMGSKDVMLVDLAKKHGCSERSVKERSMRERWFATRKQLYIDATAKAEAKLKESQASKLSNFNDDCFRAAKTAQGLLLKKLNRCIKKSNDEGVEDISEINRISNGLESTQRIGRLALGASTDNQGLVPNPDADGIGQVRLADFYKTVQFEGPSKPLDHQSAADDVAKADPADPITPDPNRKH